MRRHSYLLSAVLSLLFSGHPLAAQDNVPPHSKPEAEQQSAANAAPLESPDATEPQEAGDSIWQQLGLPEPNPDAPYANPPTLEPLFEDDFSVDTREDYRSIDGAQNHLNWQAGELVIGDSGSLGRDVEPTFWIDLELDLQFPELTSSHDTSQTRIQLQRSSGSTQYVVLSRTLVDGTSSGVIEIYDVPGTESGITSAVKIREVIRSPLQSGKWRIVCRFGLWTITTAEGGPEILVLPSRDSSPISSFALLATSGNVIVRQLSVKQWNMPAFQWNDEQRQQLGDAFAASQKLGLMFQSGQSAEAIRAGEDICRVRGQLLGPNSPEYARSLHNLSVFQARTGNYAQAERLLIEAMRIRSRVLGDHHPEYASTLNNLADVYATIGRYSEAETWCNEALAIVADVFGTENASYAMSLNNLANICRDQGKYRLAEQHYLECQDIRTRVLGARHPEYVLGLTHLAMLYAGNGNYPGAEEAFTKARDLLLDMNAQATPDFANVLHNLAAVFQEQGKLVDAEKAFDEANKTYKRLLGPDHPDSANSLFYLAQFNQLRGEYALAETRLIQARDAIAKSLGTQHPNYANVTSALATTLCHQGNFNDAAPLFAEALVIQRVAVGREHPEYARALVNLANFTGSQGDSSGARVLLEEARKIQLNSLGDRHADYGRTLGILGDTALATSEFSSAEAYYLEASRVLEKALGTGHPDHARSLHNVARVKHTRGQSGDAEQPIDLAIRSIRQHIHATSLILADQHQRFFADQLRSSLDLGLTIAVKSDEFSKVIAGHALNWKGMTLIRQRWYRAAAAASPEAAETLEKLRRVMSQWNHLVARPIAHAANKNQNSNRQTAAFDENRKQRLMELKLEREQLEKQLAQNSAMTGEEPGEISPEQLVQLLPQGSGLVDFLEFAHSEFEEANGERTEGALKETTHLAAFVLRPDHEMVMLDLGPVAPISEAIGRWEQSWGSSVEGRSAAQLLREKIWEPLLPYLQGVDLAVISPDGAVCQFPFAALPGKEPGTYLIEEPMRIVNVAVPRLLPQLLQTTPLSRDQLHFLLVGDVDFGTSPSGNVWEALGGTAAEIRQIEHLLRAQQVGDDRLMLLHRDEATENMVKRHLPTSQILHFATHGLFEAYEVPLPGRAPGADGASLMDFSVGGNDVETARLYRSALVLAGANSVQHSPENLTSGSKLPDDSLLTAEEIMYSRLENVELVVMSACQSAQGERAGGEGLLGLQRAFQIAGAKSTIGAYWNVNDFATQQLMTRFYENWLVKEMPKIEALREAQLWMLRNPKEFDEAIRQSRGGDDEEADGGPKSWDQPQYWAAWVLSGDWR